MRNKKSVQVVHRTMVAVAVALACGQVQAFQFDTGDSGLRARWDNTVKYSTIYRLRDPDATQLSDYAAAGSVSDDGDRNFKKGIASNRLDLLSEFDLVHDSNKGLRISGTAWYDDTYQQDNDNDSPASSNNMSAPYDQFTDKTRDAVGQGSLLMDAFVFTRGRIGDMPASLRIGRHAVIYGETLMSGSNGIAGAQGPVDIVKAATVPGAQVKEFLLPTNQISATLKPTSNISLGAYYQFEWEKSPFFASGSFLSPADFLGDSESFLPHVTTRTSDMSPDDDGQWGAQMRFSLGDTEYGLYAANYHDKTPSAVYLNIGANPLAGGTVMPTSFTHVYQQDIKTYGFSASTVLGSDNVSIEASVRENQPLTGGSGFVQTTTTLLGGPAFDNEDNPAYAVGTTQHLTLVDIHIIQPNTFLRDGGSIATQLDWHRVASVTKNEAAIDPTTTRSASQITTAFTADFYQVAEGLDLSIPIVLSYNLSGRSRVYSGWVEHGGSIDTGINFTYQNDWKGGFGYHHFLGSHGVGTGDGNFDQTLWDRDYISFNLSRTF
ncbi:DUF1302 domain-containing protein [Amphritea pacifica]|uniref:DUF1302 family protein n=1 Tax=Amphritea pacifica TaxID=2811233 RepID=A0ABS2W8D9_9GAMM|nr:DUF1302 family protein [Amphritea pacifica]MBN0987978.1 DUF1302 family protein [Amphritea pacifica]